MRMHHIILSYVACPAQQYFSTLSHDWNNFQKKKKKIIEHKMCVLIFSKTFVWDFPVSEFREMQS